MNTSSAGSVLNAGRWVEAVAAGNLVFLIAILGFVALGFALMSGRIEARKGATLLLGSFLIIGAPGIAKGLLGHVTAQSAMQSAALPAEAPPTLPEAKKVQQSEDPYAGASVH